MDEKNSLKDIDEKLESLCRQVEIGANLRVKTAKQFVLLADAIFNRTGAMLSPTTLKRIWGYLNERVVPRRATLDILAQFCGWKNYEDFASGQIQINEVESGNIGNNSIRVDIDIKPGESITLFWHPARVCKINYMGSRLWKVVDSKGTRLQPGTTFKCALIVSGEPLYLDDVRQNVMKPGIYVCGRKSGIRFER